MSKPSFIGGQRGRLAGLLLGALLACPPAGHAFFFSKSDAPYVEQAPKRGFHPFLHPKKKTPDAQWQYVQALDAAGRTRAAAKQALALRIYWSNAPEAPAAQTYVARRLDERGKLQAAFDAYQYLIDHYTGRFEFNEVVGRQMEIAKTLMERKKGKVLFLPGFDAPERAIPLFEKIVASAPEGAHTAEAYYLTGAAHERAYEYEEAIDAYFNALNRFPGSAFAEKAAYAQARSHVEISDDSPNDSRALDTAVSACEFFLQRYPDSEHAAEIEASRARLHSLQAAAAYARARYYDRILRKDESALIEYQTFVALFPDAPQAPEARRRIAQLAPQEK